MAVSQRAEILRPRARRSRNFCMSRCSALAKWEDNTLTASDRRILLANRYFKAVKKALEGNAKRKYFEHAGALLTADGTDDDLIKLEGTPREYRMKI